MHHSLPSKAVPGGCIIGFLGLLPIAIGGFCGWGLWKVLQLPEDERPSGATWELGIGAVGGVLIGLLLVGWGLRLAARAGMREPYSSTKPKIRF